MVQLEESSFRFTPDGTGRNLKLLGTARCFIKAEVGAEVIMSVYIIKGAQESLLGLGDTQTLGILRINLDGNPVSECRPTTKSRDDKQTDLEAA